MLFVLRYIYLTKVKTMKSKDPLHLYYVLADISNPLQ